MEKPLNRQLGLALADAPPVLRFGVKFYTPDPAQLEEEFTRYLFSMQIKADLALGSLQCNDKTAALLASYLVQGDPFLCLHFTVRSGGSRFKAVSILRPSISSAFLRFYFYCFPPLREDPNESGTYGYAAIVLKGTKKKNVSFFLLSSY